ncbi:MAG: CcmD family protein [Candidatus Latescibacteria bacterium]|jgi:CcmD family protein|nr:CcmD family protein [Candidatus Latescibacterota bacterium]
MDNFWYLFAAYTLIWIGLFVYIFSLSGRERQLSVEIEELKETLARIEAKEGA